MPNVEKAAPKVELELGGKTRRLVCDMWSLAEIERVTGESALDGSMFKKVDLNKLITMTWACLLDEDPDITRREVAKWVDFQSFDKILEKVTLAFNQVAPDTSEEDKAEAAQVEKEGNDKEPTQVKKDGTGSKT